MSKTLGSPATFRVIALAVSMFVIANLNACAPSAQSGTSMQPTSPDLVRSGGKTAVAGEDEQKSFQRLEAIRKIRIDQGFSGDFPIGPGDVVEVSVPAMEELRSRQARVSADYTIELPLIGIINVEGMGERAIRDELRKHLKEYMRDPQVDVFVREYQSREVAVAGMVQKPGLYTLTSRKDTILDMIGRAGGLSGSASTRIIFIPASPSGASTVATLLSPPIDQSSDLAEPPALNRDGEKTGPVKPVSAGWAADVPVPPGSLSEHYLARGEIAGSDNRTSPIVIDISSIQRNAQLDVPAWPGDVIIVPAAGEVMVRGWVKNPGAFSIVPGMTVLGAVTAAGGELFSSSAELLRTADGEETQTVVDLGKVRGGTQRDVMVQSGDVVIVERSVVGAVPYFAYRLFEKFNTGAYIPIL